MRGQGVWLTGTYVFHYVQPAEGAPKVDSSEDNLCDERVLDANRLEHGSAILFGSKI